MGFYFQNDYWEGAKYLPKTQQKDFVFAVVNYFFTGEEPTLKREAMGQFVQIKKRIDLAKKDADRKRTSRGQTSDNSADKSRMSLNREGEREREGEDSTNVESNPPTPLVNDSLECPDLAEPTFSLLCLKSLNEELGLSATYMPEECSRTLERYIGRYTPLDVRRMVAYKRDEWRGTRFEGCLTPNTLFSPRHFEQYMIQSMRKEVNNLDEYDRSEVWD